LFLIAHFVRLIEYEPLKITLRSQFSRTS